MPGRKPRASQGRKPPIVTQEKTHLGIEALAVERLKSKGIRKPTPAQISRLVKQIKLERTAARSLKTKLGRKPTPEEITKEMRRLVTSSKPKKNSK